MNISNANPLQQPLPFINTTLTWYCSLFPKYNHINRPTGVSFFFETLSWVWMVSSLERSNDALQDTAMFTDTSPFTILDFLFAGKMISWWAVWVLKLWMIAFGIFIESTKDSCSGKIIPEEKSTHVSVKATLVLASSSATLYNSNRGNKCTFVISVRSYSVPIYVNSTLQPNWRQTKIHNRYRDYTDWAAEPGRRKQKGYWYQN